MKWSKYNLLFKSEKFGYFIYNSLKNVLIELSNNKFIELENLSKLDYSSISVSDQDFKNFLEENMIFVKDGDEEKKLLIRRYNRNTYCFDNSRLGLTICPTTACNFRCPYCFEKISDIPARTMSEETKDKLLEFAKEFSHVKSMSVTWFGGEPTLGFHIIEDLTARFEKLDIDFTSASMITNGYLLDQEKIDKLNDLKINHIQITLDGPEEIHDKRRILVNGKGTFKRIINNIELLYNSDYKGNLSLRVNLDKTNMDFYPSLRDWYKEKFPSKKFNIYSHYVFDHTGNDSGGIHDFGCGLNIEEWSEYTLQQYKENKIPPRDGLHPSHLQYGNCIATNRNGFVVGSCGELYKCWNDVGLPEMEIGNIYDNPAIKNMELIAMYSQGVDPHLDQECRDCYYLPICSGGCASIRLHSKYFASGKPYDCTRYKSHLIPYLESYYDLFLTRAICDSYLNSSSNLVSEKGYRVIQILPESSEKNDDNSKTERSS